MSPTVLIRRRLLAWAVAVVVLTVAFAFWPSLSSGSGGSTGGVGIGCGTIHLGLAVPLTVGALCSVPIATLTVRVASERFIRYGIGWVVCLLGIITLLKVVF